jgi:regulatory protein
LPATVPADPDPVDLAARALRHRDRSRRQVDERLARAGVEEAARAEALDKLERVGYVDDARYAAARAESLAGREFGDAAILHQLVADGVARELAEETLAGLEPEADRARRLVAAHGRTARTAGRLQRKGFSQDALEAAFGSRFAENEPAA